MISWIQNTLEKHLKWLFLGLLCVIIVAFVFTIGAAPGIGEPETELHKRDFYGYNLNSLPQMEHLQQGVMMSQLLNLNPGMNQQTMELMLLSRAVLLHLADTLEVPSPNEEALRKYIETRPLFQSPSGKFEELQYQNFVNWTTSQDRLDEAIVASIFDENFRIEQVESSLAGPGFVLPHEAQLQIELMKTEFSPQLASLSFEGFDPNTVIDEADLEAYYNQHALEYQQPAEVELSYILFKPEASTGTPSDEELKAFFNKNPMAYASKGSKEAPSFEGAKSAVLVAFNADKARRKAEMAANDFTYALFNDTVKQNSEPFKALLTSSNLKEEKLPAFSQENLPSNLGIKPVYLSEVFMLDADRYYSDPLPGKDGVYVFFFQKAIPQSVAPLADVRDQVVAAYKEEMKKKAFSEKGIELAQQLKDALSKGESFENASTALKLSFETYKPFSLEEPNKDFPQNLLVELQNLDKGEVSPMLTLGDNGYFVYLAGKDTPTVDLKSEDAQKQLEQLELMTGMMTRMEILQTLIQQGLEETNPSLSDS